MESASGPGSLALIYYGIGNHHDDCTQSVSNDASDIVCSSAGVSGVYGGSHFFCIVSFSVSYGK